MLGSNLNWPTLLLSPSDSKPMLLSLRLGPAPRTLRTLACHPSSTALRHKDEGRTPERRQHPSNSLATQIGTPFFLFMAGLGNPALPSSRTVPHNAFAQQAKPAPELPEGRLHSLLNARGGASGLAPPWRPISPSAPSTARRAWVNGAMPHAQRFRRRDKHGGLATPFVVEASGPPERLPRLRMATAQSTTVLGSPWTSLLLGSLCHNPRRQANTTRLRIQPCDHVH